MAPVSGECVMDIRQLSLCVLCVQLRIMLGADSDASKSSDSAAAQTASPSSSSSSRDTAPVLRRVHETFAALIRDFCEKK